MVEERDPLDAVAPAISAIRDGLYISNVELNTRDGLSRWQDKGLEDKGCQGAGSRDGTFR
jgi:hypothetical protein